MDRQAFTTGQLVPNAQLLGMEKGKLVALGYALEAIMGAGGTVVSGLACAPTASPSLSVVVGRGSIMTTTGIDGVAYSDLGTDSNATIKQGILQEPGVTLTLTPPSTAGYSQVYLIQAKQSDVDTSTTVPFYNASNPAQPYNGPSNSGNATLTLRQSQCVVSLKAGAAATTGSQVAPSPDVGNVGLYTITLVNGQTTITAGQIVQLASAPFVPVTLPGVPGAVQAGQWVYAPTTGTNTYTATLNPAPTALPAGMEILIFFANPNTVTNPTLNLNGLGAAPVVKQSGGALLVGDLSGFVSLIRDGLGNWRFNGLPASAAGRIINIQKFAVSNTYVPTTGMTFVDVQLVGGGGAGAGGTNPSVGNVSLGSPGGGATWSRGTFTAGQIGASIAVTLGAGGAGSTGNGGSGGTSTFGALMNAPGGQGGLVFNNAAAPAINGNGALSVAPTGANIAFQQGNTPGYSQAVSAAYNGLFCGPGGDTPFGRGVPQNPNSNGAAGTGYGSGGSGVALANGGGPALGGNGAGGYCLIIEYGA